MESENVKDFVLEKLKELLLLLENFGGYVITKLDEIFPPETRGKKLHHWIAVAAPFLITGLVFMMCAWCCCKCCCGGGGGGGRRGSGKMMKAPGRDYRMPRNVFESNPRSYFKGLRASPSTSSSPYVC